MTAVHPAPATPLCPHCGVAMHEVTARARTGYLIALDQCGTCGGVWCDRWELFPLSAADARRIDPVDGAALTAATPAPRGPGRCPRCTAPLRPFRDPLLPPDARIERCPVCDGMWMNRGELARSKRSAPAHRVDRDALERLVSRAGAECAWSKVQNLDAATYASERDDDDTDPAALAWSAAPWLVLRALVRLLLRI